MGKRTCLLWTAAEKLIEQKRLFQSFNNLMGLKRAGEISSMAS